MFQVMVCRLNGAKPLLESELIDPQCDISNISKNNFINIPIE